MPRQLSEIPTEAKDAMRRRLVFGLVHQSDFSCWDHPCIAMQFTVWAIMCLRPGRWRCALRRMRVAVASSLRGDLAPIAESAVRLLIQNARCVRQGVVLGGNCGVTARRTG